MQQSTTYKLNLIETSDTFSPAPLNENAQKVEDALAGEEAARTAADAAGTAARAALDARITTLEGKTIAVGSYVGQYFADEYNIHAVQLPFTPSCVFIQVSNGQFYAFSQQYPLKNLSSIAGKIVTNGFQVQNTGGINLNHREMTYTFIAFPE